MLKKFNKLIFESLIDKSNFTFYNDENENIFCTFSIDNDYIVNAKEFNKNLTFNITDKDGSSENISEKEFSFKFKDAYKKFKEELKKYKNKEINDLNNFENKSKIKNFNDQIDDIENEDPNIRLNKDITVDDILFNFKILNDLMVENYCQCIFEIYDEKENKQYYIKSLLFIKTKNSIIIKIILQDENRQNIMTMTEEDFKLKYIEYYNSYKKAILKFEEYFNSIK